MKPNRFLYYLPATFTLPCTGDNIGIGDCVSGIYNWSLVVVGVVALVQIIYAGWLYMTAAGNTTKTGQAMHRISNAVLGIVLLFASYIILRTINPDLVGGVFSLPKITTTTTTTTTGSNVNQLSRIDNFDIQPREATANSSLNFTVSIFSSASGIDQACGGSVSQVAYKVDLISPEAKEVKRAAFNQSDFGSSGKTLTFSFSQPISGITQIPAGGGQIKFAASFLCFANNAWKTVNQSSPMTVNVGAGGATSYYQDSNYACFDYQCNDCWPTPCPGECITGQSCF